MPEKYKKEAEEKLSKEAYRQPNQEDYNRASGGNGNKNNHEGLPEGMSSNDIILLVVGLAIFFGCLFLVILPWILKLLFGG